MYTDFNLGASFTRAFDVLFQWLPQFIAALLIVIVGYFVAKIVAGIVRKSLSKLRFDSRLFSTSLGVYVKRVVGSPTKLLATIVYYVVYLGALSLAVSTLGLAPLTAFIESIYGYLPNVLAALLIFLVAATVSGSIASLATRLLGDTPTGKLIATVLPTLTMIIATFMILSQLQIAKEIVTITYAGLIATMVLGIGLSTGLGGRDAASDLIGKAVDASKDGAKRAQHDVQTVKSPLE